MEGIVVKQTIHAGVTCPASCSEQREPSNECAWVDDMLRLFGGMLFLGVSRDRLALHAPCRRAIRAEQAAERRVMTLAKDLRVAERPV